MSLKRLRPELIGLIIAAALTRFWMVFRPNSVVFDEVYFKAFAGHYFDHRYYFDIHPPLGKLLLAGEAKLFGLGAPQLLNSTAVQLRLLPALAGTLLVPLIWGILRRLGASRPFAALGAGLVLLDNALLVESRFILMDSLLLLFGLGALYWYLVARDTDHHGRRWVGLVLAALSAGASASIKWTGLTALALVILVWLWDQRGNHQSWRRRATEVAILVLLPALLYMSVFWVHFQLLPNSGDGDAFMSTHFQSTLKGSVLYAPQVHLSFLDKFKQLNVEMYHANQTLTATHPYGSHWYSWPLELRPIYYWEGEMLPDGRQGNIYLLGNPIIWWGIWLSLALAAMVMGDGRHRLRPRTIGALAITGVAYAMNFLPFMAVTRVMFLYHYFFSFLFSIMFVVMLWDDLARPAHGRLLASKPQRWIFGGVVAAVILGFLYFSPLSYGLPLSPAGLQAHMWLKSWR